MSRPLRPHLDAASVPAALALLAAACCSTSEPKTRAATSPSPNQTMTEAKDAPPAAQGGHEPEARPERPLVGGYHPREVTEDEIVTVAKEAVELVGSKEGDTTLALVAIERASSQVVAGMNFALDLSVTGKAGKRSLTVLLYRDLKNALTLTSVTNKE